MTMTDSATLSPSNVAAPSNEPADQSHRTPNQQQHDSAVQALIQEIKVSSMTLPELQAREQELLTAIQQAAQQKRQEQIEADKTALRAKIEGLPALFEVPNLDGVLTILRHALGLPGFTFSARIPGGPLASKGGKAVTATTGTATKTRVPAATRATGKVGVHRHYGKHKRRLTQQERAALLRDLTEPLATRKSIRAISKLRKCSRQTVYAVAKAAGLPLQSEERAAAGG